MKQELFCKFVHYNYSITCSYFLPSSILSGGSDTTGTILLHDTLCPPGSTHQYPIVSNTFSPISNSEQNTSYAICSIQWYPHDTGMFVTSSADRTVKVWDTNEMCPVESFKFTKPVYTHVMAAAQSHCLIAGTGWCLSSTF